MCAFKHELLITTSYVLPLVLAEHELVGSWGRNTITQYYPKMFVRDALGGQLNGQCARATRR